MPGFLPTRRLLALLAGAAPLFLLSAPGALLADLLIVAAALADALRTTSGAAFPVRRSAPARLSLGAEAEVVLEIRNPTARRVRVRCTDDLPPALLRRGEDAWERTIPPGSTVRVPYRIRAEERGPTALGDVHLRVRGPGGLVWRQDRIPRSEAVVVHPGLRDVRRYRLLGQHHRQREAGARRARQRGEGGSFESLREYARGDDPRSLDWKATARRGVPMVRQWEAERSQNLLLAIDAGRRMMERIGDRERLDHALAAALLLAQVAERHGDRVGVLVFADRVLDFLPPRRGTLPRVAEILAAVQPRMVEPDYPAAFAHLARHLRRRSLVVVFSDVVDPLASAALLAHVGRAAARHLPLVVALRNPELDAAAAAPVKSEAEAFHRAAAEELLQARTAALAAAQRAGVLVADTAPQTAVTAVVDRYLEVKRRGLL